MTWPFYTYHLNVDAYAHVHGQIQTILTYVQGVCLSALAHKPDVWMHSSTLIKHFIFLLCRHTHTHSATRHCQEPSCVCVSRVWCSAVCVCVCVCVCVSVCLCVCVCV